jgi:hypothetical protein
MKVRVRLQRAIPRAIQDSAPNSLQLELSFVRRSLASPPERKTQCYKTTR